MKKWVVVRDVIKNQVDDIAILNFFYNMVLFVALVRINGFQNKEDIGSTINSKFTSRYLIVTLAVPSN